MTNVIPINKKDYLTPEEAIAGLNELIPEKYEPTYSVVEDENPVTVFKDGAMSKRLSYHISIYFPAKFINDDEFWSMYWGVRLELSQNQFKGKVLSEEQNGNEAYITMLSKEI